jgi:CRISPR-associated protein Cas6
MRSACLPRPDPDSRFSVSTQPYRIAEPADVLFRLYGDCVRSGYGYQLLAAIKALDVDLAARKDVWFGPIEGVEHRRGGFLHLNSRSRWRVRCSLPAARSLLQLAGKQLIIGCHVVRLGSPAFEVPTPSEDMHAELVTFKSLHWPKREHPTLPEFAGRIHGALRHLGFDGKIVLGRKRMLIIAEHPAQTGWPVGIRGLNREQAEELIRRGLGGRRHMGAGLFVPGQLPPWWREQGW